MPILRVVDEVRLPDSPPLTSTWCQSSGQLGQADSKLKLTPPPGLQGHIFLGHQQVPMPLTQLLRVLLLHKWPP